MGLFGGFKAKFTRNRKRKENTVQVVLPLQYRVKAEFDSQNPPDPVPIGIRPALRKPRTPARSETFANTYKTVSEKLKNASINKALINSSEPGATKREERYDKAEKSYPGNDDAENIRENSLYISSTDDNYEIITDPDEQKDSTLILNRSLTSDTNAIAEQFLPEPESSSNSAVDQEQKYSIQFYSAEEEEEDTLDMSQYNRQSFSYSNQATSLFFIESEPTITRPRRIQLNVDEGEEDVDC